MGKLTKAEELYVSWVNGNREHVMNEIATSDATMVMMAEISLMFQGRSDHELTRFLQHVAKHA